jgi:hypothetical protein
MQVLHDSKLASQDGRRFVGAHLRDQAVDAQVTDLAILLVSELITNAIEHGPPPLCLQVIVAVDRVRVEVHDSNPAPPVLGLPDFDAEDGRGVWLIDTLSTRWGSRPQPPGKIVWLELATPATDSADNAIGDGDGPHPTTGRRSSPTGD